MPFPSPTDQTFAQQRRSSWRDEHAPELLSLIAALVIGLSLGGFAVYLWHVRDQRLQLVQQQAQLTTLTTKLAQCESPALQNRLQQCLADFARAQGELAALTAPAPALSDAQSIPLPPSPLEAEVHSSTQTPPLPAPRPAQPAKAEQKLPPLPKPKPKPPPPPLSLSPPASDAAGQEEASPVIAPRLPATTGLAPLTGFTQLTLSVGEERKLSSSRTLRLVAVSRRTNGRFCVLAGNGLASTRIASGTTQRVSWGGQRLTISATIADTDTCKISLRPLS